jgi:hypothetical protein
MRHLGKAGRSDWDSRHLGGEQEGFLAGIAAILAANKKVFTSSF